MTGVGNQVDSPVRLPFSSLTMGPIEYWGRMGGHECVVFDKDTDKVEQLVEQGAVAASPRWFCLVHGSLERKSRKS